MRAHAAQAPRGATLLERTWAYLADAVLTFVVWAIVFLVLTGGDPGALTREAHLGVIAGMLFLVIPFVYFVLAEGITGTTVGKRAFGLQVVDDRGQPVGMFGAVVRNVLRLAWALGPLGPLFLLLDVVLVQWDEDERRIGDAAGRTRVIRRGPALVGL